MTPEEARRQISANEKTIGKIKAHMRALASSEASDVNSLTVAWIKTEGLPDTAKPSLKLQLSSPIEDADLTSLFDPLATGDPNPTTVVFDGVETGQATLTVSATDAGEIPLGVSIAYDIATLVAPSDTTELDRLTEPVENELVVAILPPEIAEEKQQDQDSLISSAVCTMTLRLTFRPSVSETREALYEQLNVATREKAAAVQVLRKAAVQEASAQQVVTTSSNSKPAVQRGFLKNKPTEKKPKIVDWYHRHLGENSPFRRIGLVAKNYIIFFGLATFLHFRGQVLALPPPV